MTAMWVTRGMLVTLSAALAVALVAHGNVVIGALIGALALTRAVRLILMGRRRARFRRRLLAGRARRRSVAGRPVL